MTAAARDADRLHVQGTPSFSVRVGDGKPVQGSRAS
jgi:hypothetical protein